MFTQIYGVSLTTLNWYNSAYLATGLVLAIPTSLLLNQVSLKTSYIIAGALSLVGVWLRVFINSSFIFAFVG